MLLTKQHQAVDHNKLEAIELASRDEIEALQLTRLRLTLTHAYENVAHYRRAFDAQGVHPNDLKQLSDQIGRASCRERV